MSRGGRFRGAGRPGGVGAGTRRERTAPGGQLVTDSAIGGGIAQVSDTGGNVRTTRRGTGPVVPPPVAPGTPPARVLRRRTGSGCKAVRSPVRSSGYGTPAGRRHRGGSVTGSRRRSGWWLRRSTSPAPEPGELAAGSDTQWVAGSVVYGPVNQVSGVTGDVHITTHTHTGGERALYRVDAFPVERAAPTAGRARAVAAGTVRPRRLHRSSREVGAVGRVARRHRSGGVGAAGARSGRTAQDTPGRSLRRRHPCRWRGLGGAAGRHAYDSCVAWPRPIPSRGNRTSPPC
ncbi:hypothetical protein EHYA_09596 [Embleya hyalina]|uniref:Uncharacterized protein n=1 Tax=Embleya hyalina TaxID=516124 RepID=A0A401Z4N2_9ACTN|nr:hypothetical protein EHYA_09596 [Embleya hyalina]